MINAIEARKKTKENISKRNSSFEEDYKDVISSIESKIKIAVDGCFTFCRTDCFDRDIDLTLVCDYLIGLGYGIEIPPNYLSPPIIISWI